MKAKRMKKLVNLVDLKKDTLHEVKDEMIGTLKTIAPELQKVSDPSSFTYDLDKTIQKSQYELHLM